ncbi:MAG: hypothetical protein FWF94_04480 [Oscillospiraceae bacterium]|nr:hypothetical protein [Oscillospiraceae bacterium]
MRKLLLAFILVPVAVTSVIGLFALSAFSAKLTSVANAESAYANATGITALVGEYTAFLTAAAELDAVKEASSKSEAGRFVEPFLTKYVKNGDGIYDILITNGDGFVFASHMGEYNSSETFRDVSELIGLAPTPSPVSGFYDEGRFYCAKPVKDDETGDITGYIVLITENDLIPDYVSSKSDTLYKGGKGVFAVFDDYGYIISTDGGVGSVLKNGVETHRDRILPVDAYYELFEQGGRFGAAGNIEGTKWRWISLYPITGASPSAFDIFIIAFDISAAICLVNIVIMVIITKKRKKNTGNT